MATPVPLIATDAELTHGTGAITTNCHGLIFVRTGDRAYTNLRTSDYSWAASGSGTNEWVLQTAAGGAVTLTDVSDRIVYQSGAMICTRGTAGSLAEGQWDISGGSLYIRTFNTGSGQSPNGITDPDSETDGYVWTSVPNTSFSWGDGNAVTVREVRWDFVDNGVTTTRYGFNGSHRYTVGGTVKLTITDSDGTVASVTRGVTLASWSPTTYYVDSGAADNTGDGLSTGTAKKTITGALTTIGVSGSNVRILLKRGQTHTPTASVRLDGSNVYWGAYGTGADPIVVTSTYNWDVRGDDVLFEDIQTGNYVGLKPSGITFNRLALINVTPYGSMGSFLSCDRLHIGLHVEDCVAADLSAYGGMNSYYCYSAKRAANGDSTALRARTPLAMKSFYGFANDYGQVDETCIRVSGDYLHFENGYLEQTNIDVSNRAKGASIRIVGGTHVSSKNCTHVNDGDTSAISNAELGTAGFGWAPADGQSYSSRWVLLEDCVFKNATVSPSIKTGGLTATFCDDVTLRRPRFSYPSAALYRDAISIGSQNTAVCNRWRVEHMTYSADAANLCKPFNLIGLSGMLTCVDWTIGKVVIVNPSLALTDNDTDVSCLIDVRTEDEGVTEFESITDIMYATPGTGAGEYPTNFAVKFRSTAGGATAKWTLATFAAKAYCSNLTLADASLESDLTLTNNGQTALTFSTTVFDDCPVDSRGYRFYVSGPIGAFSVYQSSSVNAGGGSFPVWI